MLLIPDASTAQMDPYTAVPTLVLICNVKDPITGKAYSRDPRYVAQKAEAYVKKSGVADTIFIGPELEFFFFDSIRFDQSYNHGYYFIDSEAGAWNSGKEGTPDRPNLGYKPRYKQGYFPVPPMDQFQDIRSDMVLALESVGIRVEVHHHEVATGGQTEIDMRFDTLTKMADRVLWYKYCAKNTAKKWGKTATFMPKPLFQDNGSGMHTHQSLWKNGKNLFYERGGYADISKMCLYYIGGILKHAPALLAFIAPSTNSYKRLVPGYEAPINLVYSQRNRSAAIRIPMYSKAEGAKRIEFRTPDPTCNPYLSFAACVMAGLDGIANKIDPGKPVDKDLYELPARGAEEDQAASRRARHRARQPREGSRVPPQGRRVHSGPDRDLDRVQAEERGRSDSAASAPVRVRPLLRHLDRRDPSRRQRPPALADTAGAGGRGISTPARSSGHFVSSSAALLFPRAGWRPARPRNCPISCRFHSFSRPVRWHPNRIPRRRCVTEKVLDLPGSVVQKQSAMSVMQWPARFAGTHRKQCWMPRGRNPAIRGQNPTGGRHDLEERRVARRGRGIGGRKRRARVGPDASPRGAGTAGGTERGKAHRTEGRGKAEDALGRVQALLLCRDGGHVQPERRQQGACPGRRRITGRTRCASTTSIRATRSTWRSSASSAIPTRRSPSGWAWC
jgi:glutamine synthetase